MPSAGAVRLRVAISTRASARRWPEVRASSSMRPVRPRRSLACGTVGLEEVVLEAVELVGHDGARDGVEGHLAQPHAREARSPNRRCARPCAPLLRRRPRRGRPAASNRPAPGRSRRSPARRPGPPASPRHGPWRPRCGDAGPRRWRWAASPPMAPSRQASATAGRWRRVRPRRTRRLAAARETRQRAESHEAAVLAPSAAHSSPASKAAVASVTKDSKREDRRCELFHRLAVAVVGRTRFDQCLECFGEVRQLHVSMEARSCDRFGALKTAEIALTIRPRRPTVHSGGPRLFPQKATSFSDSATMTLAQRQKASRRRRKPPEHLSVWRRTS